MPGANTKLHSFGFIVLNYWVITSYSQELNAFMIIFIINVVYTVCLAANAKHTLWFLIFVKSYSGSVAVYVVD